MGCGGRSPFHPLHQYKTNWDFSRLVSLRIFFNSEMKTKPFLGGTCKPTRDRLGIISASQHLQQDWLMGKGGFLFNWAVTRKKGRAFPGLPRHGIPFLGTSVGFRMPHCSEEAAFLVPGATVPLAASAHYCLATISSVNPAFCDFNLGFTHGLRFHPLLLRSLHFERELF